MWDGDGATVVASPLVRGGRVEVWHFWLAAKKLQATLARAAPAVAGATVPRVGARAFSARESRR
jgi:hypothetical protein